MIYSEVYIQIIVFIFGAMLGSFANVVIYRYPKGESVVTPRSHCYSCKKTIPFYFNIPIISWLLLLGKCFFCKSKISIRYFLVELLMATLFVIAYQKFGLSVSFYESLIFIFGLIIISMIDFDHFIIPDLFSLSGIVIGVIGAVINPDRSVIDSLLGLFIGGGFLYFTAYIFYVIRKQMGMGGGDIKLIAWVGAVLGLVSVPFVIIVSCFVGSVVGVCLMLKSGEGRNQKLAFGPYISLAALIYLIWGQNLVLIYKNWFLAGV